MAKIQITGYILTDDMDSGSLDPTDRSGLSAAGYEELMRIEIEELSDLRVEVVTK